MQELCSSMNDSFRTSTKYDGGTLNIREKTRKLIYNTKQNPIDTNI